MSFSTTSKDTSRVAINNLLYILRRANTHYSQIAATIRNSLRPTHHAKKRARSLRLSVSIDAALQLDPKQISTIPLPILELDTPYPEQALAPMEPAFEISHTIVGREREIKRLRLPILKCDIPEDINPGEEMLSAVSVYSNVSSNTPASADDVHAPVVLRGQNVPWRPVTSRWSMTTVGESDEEVEAGAGYSSDYEEGLDLPISADAEFDCVVLPNRPQPMETATTGQAPKVAGLCHSQLEVPLDVTRFSWDSNILSAQSSFCESSSSSSTSGPVTPANYEDSPKIMICIKRKSVVSDIDMEDTTLEKRPKYERKSWVKSATRRIVRKMPASRRY